MFISLVSCSKKKIPVADTLSGSDYYPTKQGKYVIYDIDSTVYTDLPVDTINYKYRIKEKIADSFTDNEGQPAIRLERYIKKFSPTSPYDSIPWTMKEVWLVNASQRSIQVVEGNVRYTKLIFPVQEKAVWDGNAHNTLGTWQYSYDYADHQENINGQLLANVLLVKQKEFKTLISYEHYAEKYAKGVGLVQREITNILSNTIVVNVAIENRIQTGIIYKQTLVNYGYE